MQLTSEDRPGWLDAAAAAVLARLLDAGHGPVTR
jgi:hypothetical protein